MTSMLHGLFRKAPPAAMSRRHAPRSSVGSAMLACSLAASTCFGLAAAEARSVGDSAALEQPGAGAKPDGSLVVEAKLGKVVQNVRPPRSRDKQDDDTGASDGAAAPKAEPEQSRVPVAPAPVPMQPAAAAAPAVVPPPGTTECVAGCVAAPGRGPSTRAARRDLAAGAGPVPVATTLPAKATAGVPAETYAPANSGISCVAGCGSTLAVRASEASSKGPEMRPTATDGTDKVLIRRGANSKKLQSVAQ